MKPVKKFKSPKGKVVGIQYDDGHFRIDNARLSYPHLSRPQESTDGGTAKFGATLLLPKDTHTELVEAMKSAGDKLAKDKKIKIARDKYFIKDGDEDYPDKEECQGMWVISARENKRPVLRDADNVEVDKDDIEEIMYAGCFVGALVAFWIQDNKHGKRCNANLRSVKFMKDGEPFGAGQVDDSEVWGDDDWSEDDDGDDDDL